MYATMIACAFASCSKDDVVGSDGPEVGEGNASLTIVVNSKQAGTKAVKPTGTTDNTITGEDAIKNLTLVVFNSAGQFLASADATNASTGEVTVAGINPQAVQFMVFANMDIANLSTLTATTIFSQPISIADGYFNVSENGLPMTSSLVSATLVSGDNYYGYDADDVPSGANSISEGSPLGLVRNVARVDLQAVKLSMADSDYESGSATFQFTGVYVKNAATKALLNNVASDASYVTGTTDAYTYYYDAPASALATTTQTFTSATTRENAENVAALNAYYYVLVNTQGTVENSFVENDNATKLVVAGNFGLTNGVHKTTGQTVSLQPQAGLYPVTVGVDGMPSAVDAVLKSNKIYKITLLVAGPGKLDGGRATFYVQTEVVDWSEVSQVAPVK